MKMCMSFVMELELILRRLWPLKLSHFRQFCIVGYGVCVINSSYNFHWTFLKLCLLVADIIKMCMWILMVKELISKELRAFELNHFRPFFAFWGMEFV